MSARMCLVEPVCEAADSLRVELFLFKENKLTIFSGPGLLDRERRYAVVVSRYVDQTLCIQYVNVRSLCCNKLMAEKTRQAQFSFFWLYTFPPLHCHQNSIIHSTSSLISSVPLLAIPLITSTSRRLAASCLFARPPSPALLSSSALPS
jgi:hypothetical protein